MTNSEISPTYTPTPAETIQLNRLDQVTGAVNNAQDAFIAGNRTALEVQLRRPNGSTRSVKPAEIEAFKRVAFETYVTLRNAGLQQEARDVLRKHNVVFVSEPPKQFCEEESPSAQEEHVVFTTQG